MKLPPPPPYNGTPEEIAAWFDILLNRSNELMIDALAKEKANKCKKAKVSKSATCSQ